MRAKNAGSGFETPQAAEVATRSPGRDQRRRRDASAPAGWLPAIADAAARAARSRASAAAASG